MKLEARWVLVSSAALAACIGCGSLPDWSDLQGLGSAGTPASGGSEPSLGGDTSAGGDPSSGGATPQGGSAPVGGSSSDAGASTAGASTGGAAPQGGSGGGVNQEELDKAELATALMKLNGFVYTDPCKFSNNGSDVTTLNGCNTSDICWSTQDLGQYSEKRQIAIGGTAGHTYEIDLNVLGVIEPRDYPASPNCTRLADQPASTVGMLDCMDGYANKGSVTFNVWELNIPAPAKKFYLNGVPVHPPHRVDVADNRFKFQVNAGTTITFTMDDLNGGLIRNCTNKITTSKYKTAAGAAVNAPASVQQPYNGQWFQLTVLDAKIVR